LATSGISSSTSTSPLLKEKRNEIRRPFYDCTRIHYIATYLPETDFRP
jgi:hypothetical protein